MMAKTGKKNSRVQATGQAKEGLVDTTLKMAFTRFQPLYIIYLVVLFYFEIEYRGFELFKFTPYEEALRGGAYFFIAICVFVIYLFSAEILRKTAFHLIIEKTKIKRLIISALFCLILLFLGKGSHEIFLLFVPWIMLGAIYSETKIKQFCITTFMVLCFAVPVAILEYPDLFWGRLLFCMFFTYGIAYVTGYSWNKLTDAETRFSNLDNIVRQINDCNDLDSLLKYTLKSCIQITKSKNGWILLYDQISKKLIIKANIEKGEFIENPNREFSLDKGIIGFVAREKEPYLCNDVFKDKHYEEHYPDVKSEICVPMLWSDELIGIIDVDSPDYNGFDGFDKNNLLIISMAAASSIKRINYLGKLDTVMQINGLIARNLNLDRVLETFINESIRLLKGNYGLILFIDSSLNLIRSKVSDNLHILATEEIKERLGKKDKIYESNASGLQMMTKLCSVITRGRKYVHKDINEEVGNENFILHWFFKETFGSVIAMPLEYEGKVIGELTIGYTEPNSFSSDQVRLLEMIGEQTSIAIKNAYDFEKADIDLEMKNREIETINRIVNIIRTAENVDEVIELILSEAVNLVNAFSGHVRLFDGETESLILKACIGDYKKIAESRKELGNDSASQAFLKEESKCIAHFKNDKYYKKMLKRYRGTQKYTDFIKFFEKYKRALVVPFKGDADLKGYIVVFSKLKESETKIHMNLLKRFSGLMVNALNMARLNEITKKQAQERQAKLKLLSKIGLSLREAGNFEELMELIVKYTFETLNSESCSLFLLNKKTFKLERKENIAEVELNFDEEYGIDEGITGKLLNKDKGETLLFKREKEIEEEAVPKYHEEYKSALPSGKIEHLLAVPLIGENKKVFGVLRIMNKKSQKYITADKVNKLQKSGFSLEDKELMETIGSTVSVAISDDRKAEKLKIITKTSEIIAPLVDVKRISEEIVKTITSEELGYPACVLSLIENEELVPIAWEGISYENIKNCVVPLSKGIGGKAVTENRIQYIEDVCSDDANINGGYLFKDFALHEKFKSLLVIPLSVGDFPIGKISVYTRQTYNFFPYEKELLETLSSQVAITISNSRYMLEKSLFDEKMKNIMNISMVEQISSTIIHDVNSLFNNFGTQLELVDNDLDNRDFEEAKKNLEIAFNDIKKTAGYTDSLQFYRKARPGETEKDVREIIKTACDMYSGTAQRRKIKLATTFTDIPPRILVNENKLSTVLLNLIFNAVDFSRDRQTVHVKALYSGKNKCVQIEVQDYGRGMDEKTQKHIFELFYTNRDGCIKNEGTGLGLYIVKNICTTMHWELTFESKKFKGTTFKIKIPVEEKNENRKQFSAG